MHRHAVSVYNHVQWWWSSLVITLHAKLLTYVCHGRAKVVQSMQQNNKEVFLTLDYYTVHKLRFYFGIVT